MASRTSAGANGIEALGNMQRLAFCASACERFFSNPYVRASLAKWSEPSWRKLRATLDLLWTHVTDNDVSKAELSRFAELRTSWVPHDEDPTWDGLPEAQNAAIMVVTTLDHAARDDFEDITDVSTACFECIRNYLIGKLYPTPRVWLPEEVEEREKQIDSSELFLEEEAKQAEDVRFLESRELTRATVAELRTRATSSPYRFHSF